MRIWLRWMHGDVGCARGCWWLMIVLLCIERECIQCHEWESMLYLRLSNVIVSVGMSRTWSFTCMVLQSDISSCKLNP